MPKTKFVRIATSGPTIDGRTIDPKQLTDAADTYNPETYTARINIEHVRGFSGQPPFQAYGDVLALKTEPINLTVGGKTESRTALMAQLDVKDGLVELKKNGQKLYSSIELLPNFAGTGKAYLGGLAATDSPAALGTERLEFTSRAKAQGNLVSESEEFNFELDEASQSQTENAAILSGMKDFFAGLFSTAKPAEAAQAAPVIAAAATPDLTAFAADIQKGFTKLTEAIDASNKANAASVKEVADSLATFRTELSSKPADGYVARQPHAGGNGRVLADC